MNNLIIVLKSGEEQCFEVDEVKGYKVGVMMAFRNGEHVLTWDWAENKPLNPQSVEEIRKEIAALCLEDNVICDWRQGRG